MKKQTIIKLVVLTCACVGLGMAPASAAIRFAHYTNYLEGLQTVISNKLDDAAITNAAQRRALVQANATLNRSSRTFSGDLNELSIASTALSRGGFNETNAADLTDAQNTSFEKFYNEALNQEAGLLETLGLATNGVPRSISNQIAQLNVALSNAAITTNTIPQRARALNLAYTKLGVSRLLINRLIKAPATLEGKNVLLSSGRGRTRASLTLTSDNYNQSVDGGWSFNRTSSNTGTVTVHETGGGTTDYDLLFKTTASGTYNSATTTNLGTNGTFRISTPRRR